ncbi:Nif3-like dinuclear metal center hexameric protein [Plasticicumulans acidivorans]|uniref:GTP cyclohydrolase 1 type 2 homolog n=1 Tax=Plasticicumulans acidivorans TaxID=886464 RepID=A0A317MV48_9GAMM|nr:Nif3-like dinuclear metal center hexameric protein [Plasticicumulans acidivorans]PWV61812.1 dinuclear metal center YbgI/SA1388 family protein [Plasticicumulans acidivorans]
MRLADLVAYTDELLAVGSFSDYCPNGLQVEGRGEVRRIVGGVTACQALLDAAVAARADLVLVHHGYFWKGEEARITGMRKRRLATLLTQDMSLLAYHLPLDAHPQLGNNAQLARVLGFAVDGVLGGGGRTPGLVMTGTLGREMSGAELAAHIGGCLGREPLHVAGSSRAIRRVAWCSGGAQSYIDLAIAAGVDAYLTGEVSEPTVHSARENELHFFAAGHHATERYGVQALGAHLAQSCGLQFEFIDVPNPA